MSNTELPLAVVDPLQPFQALTTVRLFVVLIAPVLREIRIEPRCHR